MCFRVSDHLTRSTYYSVERMVFKFGILVLLFALAGVLAKQDLPPVPTANIVSALRQVPRFRRGLLRHKHSQIRSLVSDSFRRFLLSSEGNCAWDVQTEECSLSVPRIRNLLKKSDSEFAEMLVKRLTCTDKTTKRGCNKESSCLWAEEFGECDYVDVRRGHEDSPCAKAAPRLFDTLEATTLCEKLDSSKECEDQRECFWSSEDASCDVDPFLIFLGIEDFQDNVTLVTQTKAFLLGFEYAFLSFSDNFTYQSYLDYKPNNTGCPNITEPLVCEYVDAILPGLMGPHFYCSEKYESAAFGCILDNLCSWNGTSAECEAAESVIRSAASSATKVLTDSIPDGIDKNMITAFFDCADITEEGSCTGTCVWNALSKDCSANLAQYGIFFTELTNNSTDALCTYLNIDGSSDCYTQDSETECQNTDFCRWDAEDYCAPKEELYLSAAADRDRKLKKRYKRAKEQCSSQTTEQTCVE